MLSRNPGVNFANILRAVFLYKNVLHSFYMLIFGFIIFWQKEIGAKAARKMLVNLSTEYRLIMNLILKKTVTWNLASI